MAAKKSAKKKSAGKKAVKKKSGGRLAAGGGCPDNPAAFFTGVEGWATAFRIWANDVEACYDDYPCGTAIQRLELTALCEAFDSLAATMQAWADGVEACYQENCITKRDHNPPPPPPFGGR